MGAVAYGAGELLMGDNKEKNPLKRTNRTLYEVLETAKSQNEEIKVMIPYIENIEVQKDLKEICESVQKIIDTITSKPNKRKQLNNFFDYYLPVTVKMVKQYDEIENQRLASSEGKNFMKQAQKMIHDINDSFQKQLAMLYQSDLMDADAEMKVFESMLKADGFDSNDLNLK